MACQAQVAVGSEKNLPSAVRVVEQLRLEIEPSGVVLSAQILQCLQTWEDGKIFPGKVAARPKQKLSTESTENTAVKKEDVAADMDTDGDDGCVAAATITTLCAATTTTADATSGAN